MLDRRIAVLGLGNPVLSDDRAGLAAAGALQRLLEAAPLPGVAVLTSTRGGFEFIDLLQGYAHALIIDCYENPDPEPGRVRRLDLSHVAGSARLVAQHDISIGTAFALAARLGISMPSTVEIYAVEAADIRTISEEMSPAVTAAIGPLAQELYARLTELTFSPAEP